MDAVSQTNPQMWQIGQTEAGPFLVVPVPTGSHYYSNKTWVGSVLVGDTPEAAFEALRHNATPFQFGARINETGDVITIPGLGPVRETVFADQMTIVNSTMDGHLLAPEMFGERWFRKEPIYL